MTILITRHDKIGDFITAVPMAKVLKEQTDHKIIFLVSKVNETLALNLPFIDEVIVYTTDTLVLVKTLRSKNIDISISAFIDNKLGVALFLSGIKIRVAPATKIAQIFFNKTIKQRRSKVEKTEWQYNLELLKLYDDTLKLEFNTPLLDFGIKRENFIIFHPGSGGSSDGNLKLDDYISLAQNISSSIDVVFTFGPDDLEIKKYILLNIKNSNIKIKDNFDSLYSFTKYIASSKLFISTSTGPMHLAGLTNTPTLSFFGSNLFASSKRWATISELKYQNNFEVPMNYNKEFYYKIQQVISTYI